MRIQSKITITWVLLKLPLVAFALEEAVGSNSMNGSADVVLLKFPLRSLRHPRQQQPVQTTAQSSNQTSSQITSTTPRPEIIPWKANPGTAVNVQSILTGLFTSDVRPILAGSTAFIPQGNLKELAESVLFSLSPVIQNVLFGPGPNTQFQTHYFMPNHNQSQSQVVQTSEAPLQEETSTMRNEPTVASTSAPSPSQTTKSSSIHLESDTQLKVEEENGGMKNKEYIYLVLRPDEYEEYLKITMLSKNKSMVNQMPQDSMELKINMTLPTSHPPPPHDNEDDEYEAFVLNNVTDLHLREFFFNGTHANTKIKN